jgi:hypothetical protein
MKTLKPLALIGLLAILAAIGAAVYFFAGLAVALIFVSMLLLAGDACRFPLRGGAQSAELQGSHTRTGLKSLSTSAWPRRLRPLSRPGGRG